MRNFSDLVNLPALWILGVALALLICVPAHAGDVKVSWTAPTTCADGSVITNCPTTGFEVLAGTSITGTLTTAETVAPSVTTRTYANLGPGTRCFALKTVSNSVKSDESTRACADVPSLPPKAPQGITVTVNVTVSAGP